MPGTLRIFGAFDLSDVGSFDQSEELLCGAVWPGAALEGPGGHFHGLGDSIDLFERGGRSLGLRDFPFCLREFWGHLYSQTWGTTTVPWATLRCEKLQTKGGE